MHTILFMGPSFEADVQRVREFAERPENVYRLGMPPPGDNPSYVVQSGNIRAVFSWTESPDWLLRHMTISVTPLMSPDVLSSHRGLPLPFIGWTMAHRFGFEGVTADAHGFVYAPGTNWAVGEDSDEQCLVVQQRIRHSRPPRR